MLTKTDIEKYFNAEKSESLLFVIRGGTVIMLALIVLYYKKNNWCKGGVSLGSDYFAEKRVAV